MANQNNDIDYDYDILCGNCFHFNEMTDRIPYQKVGRSNEKEAYCTFCGLRENQESDTDSDSETDSDPDSETDSEYEDEDKILFYVRLHKRWDQEPDNESDSDTDEEPDEEIDEEIDEETDEEIELELEEKEHMNEDSEWIVETKKINTFYL